MGVLHEDDDGGFWIRDDKTGEVLKVPKSKTTAAGRNALRAALPGKEPSKIEPEDPNGKDEVEDLPVVSGGGYVRRATPLRAPQPTAPPRRVQGRGQ